jgi:hypothetical protein
MPSTYFEPQFRADDGRHVQIRSRFRDESAHGARSTSSANARTTGVEAAGRCEEMAWRTRKREIEAQSSEPPMTMLAVVK